MLTALRAAGRFTRTLFLAIVTPLLEKNPAKTFVAAGVPLVFSMARLVVLAFASVMLRQIWRAGVAGWPDATLAIAVVLSLPIFGALDRVRPEQVIALGTTLLSRFGIGDVRRIGSVYANAFRSEPSPFDDHRRDAHA
jgi:hypothetical protein